MNDEDKFTELKEIMKQQKDPYGDVDLVPVDFNKFCVKIAACEELVRRFDFNPFKYAVDNNIHLSISNVTMVNSKTDSPIDDWKEGDDYAPETELAEMARKYQEEKIIKGLEIEKAYKKYQENIKTEKEKAKQAFIDGKGIFKKAVEE